MLRAEAMARYVEPLERRRFKMPPEATKPPAIPWPRRSVHSTAAWVTLIFWPRTMRCPMRPPPVLFALKEK